MRSVLSRAMEAMELAASDPGGLTVTDLADATHISKSTASRLLSSMVEAGMLERDEAQRHFLDVRLLASGCAIRPSSYLLDVARPHILAALKDIGVSVFVAVARENKAIYLESIKTPGRISLHELGFLCSSDICLRTGQGNPRALRPEDDPGSSWTGRLRSSLRAPSRRRKSSQMNSRVFVAWVTP